MSFPDKRVGTKDIPVFSVLVPTYNRAEKLGRALRSLVEQSYRNFEVIVCDDGSTDRTIDVVERLNGILSLTYVRDEHWGGPARPRNHGIRTARGAWICFLDADDWWYPNKLETVSRYLDDADVVYHGLHTFTGDGRRGWGRARARQVRPPVVADLLKNGNALPNSAVTVKKSVAEKAGGLTEDKMLVSLEDFDFWLKIARVTDRFIYIPKCLGAYSTDKDNITEFTGRQIQRIETFYDKNLGLLSGPDREAAERLRDYMVGRIKQRIGSPEEAAQLLKKAIKSPKLEIKLKSFAVYALIKLGWGGAPAARDRTG